MAQTRCNWIENRSFQLVRRRGLVFVLCLIGILIACPLGRASEEPFTESGATLPKGALARLAPGGRETPKYSAISSLQYARNGRWLVFRHADGTIRVWDLSEGKEK